MRLKNEMKLDVTGWSRVIENFVQICVAKRWGYVLTNASSGDFDVREYRYVSLNDADTF